MLGNAAGHSMVRVRLALRWIPQMMGDELHHQQFWCWPREGRTGCGERPALDIPEIRSEGSQRILTHPSLNEMAQCRDILVRQNLREPVAAPDRQDRGERIQLL